MNMSMDASWDALSWGALPEEQQHEEARNQAWPAPRLSAGCQQNQQGQSAVLQLAAQLLLAVLLAASGGPASAIMINAAAINATH